jgi:hypothetical protein
VGSVKRSRIRRCFGLALGGEDVDLFIYFSTENNQEFDGSFRLRWVRATSAPHAKAKANLASTQRCTCASDRTRAD